MHLLLLLIPRFLAVHFHIILKFHLSIIIIYFLIQYFKFPIYHYLPHFMKYLIIILKYLILPIPFINIILIIIIVCFILLDCFDPVLVHQFIDLDLINDRFLFGKG